MVCLSKWSAVLNSASFLRRSCCFKPCSNISLAVFNTYRQTMVLRNLRYARKHDRHNTTRIKYAAAEDTALVAPSPSVFGSRTAADSAPGVLQQRRARSWERDRERLVRGKPGSAGLRFRGDPLGSAGESAEVYGKTSNICPGIGARSIAR